jgi:hypothetical protein
MVEETKLKVGDILTCHSKVIMEHNGDIRTTVGKSYKIIEILYLEGEVKLVIKNDHNEDHRFTYKNYNKWFYNLKELRRNKLKKIQDVESW